MNRPEIHWPECDRAECTLRAFSHPMRPAQTARARGWQVGDVLEGDEGYGVERIRLTAIGESGLLAMSERGSSAWGDEPWTLDCRCWRKVAPP